MPDVLQPAVITGSISPVLPMREMPVSAIRMVAVKSSHLKEVGYDATAGRLLVRFNNGRLYQYTGVPRLIYEKMLRQKSVGAFFARVVKNRYETEELK